ncbi:hypothetical protein BS47DRAFT_1361514 [Hydnum rufescens UP504]|uniref:Uncharacterized protein n=1 Tax=Hydnum rufescens UP504 TaxID=1448309 RepID=A0A9P6AZN0_9AGAM|nr:hypothetical protein BS47DRAFT_1361514 [Hydnum rufescens UP504]
MRRCHTPAPVDPFFLHQIMQTRPRAKYGGMCSHPGPQPCISPAPRTTNQVCHTPTSVGTYTQPDECTDNAQDKTWEHAATSIPDPQFYTMTKQIHATHLPKWGLIPNPTNVQTTPRTKHRSMQPPLSPDPRFYAMTKQIHATHPPKWGLIPNLTNVQTMPRTKHRSTQPPLSPTLDFTQQ